jgi:hypothetical protein
MSGWTQAVSQAAPLSLPSPSRPTPKARKSWDAVPRPATPPHRCSRPPTPNSGPLKQPTPPQENVLLLLQRRFSDPAWHASHKPYWDSLPGPGRVWTKETFTEEDMEGLQDEDLVRSSVFCEGGGGEERSGAEKRKREGKKKRNCAAAAFSACAAHTPSVLPTRTLTPRQHAQPSYRPPPPARNSPGSPASTVASAESTACPASSTWRPRRAAPACRTTSSSTCRPW